MPVINAFQQNYHGISITCTLTDSHSDVIDEKIDIGLRTGFLRDNRYVARKSERLISSFLALLSLFTLQVYLRV